MSDYFSKREMEHWVSEVNLDVGGTANLFHCKEGKDNDRLFITRREHTLYLGYCHHCGKRGVYNTSAKASISTLKAHYDSVGAASGARHKGERKLPADCRVLPSDWSRGARVWVRGYGITDDEVVNYGITYSPSCARVVLPVYDGAGLALYQTRRIDAEDMGPKYITYNNRHGSLWYSNAIPATNTLVLCEDIISGIRLGRHISSAALLGTSISDRALRDVVDRWGSFIIFMDDDNADVRMKQLTLKNRLEVFAPTRIIHTNGRDAKEHTDKELEELL